jgi:hypothetical protein
MATKVESGSRKTPVTVTSRNATLKCTKADSRITSSDGGMK